MDRSTDFSVLLVLFSLAFVAWTTRRRWAGKHEEELGPPSAPRLVQCRHFRAWYRCPICSLSRPILLASCFLSVSMASAQSFHDAPCSRASFFAEQACTVSAAPPVAAAPAPSPDVPLFTKETVSPYTAPELLHLSNHRTLENARQYVRRQLERNDATEEVTRLVQQAWQEMGVPHAR